MRLNIQRLAALLVISILLLLLSACTDSANSNKPNDSIDVTEIAVKTITLVEYGASPKRAAALRELLYKFEQDNPDLRVSLVVFGSESDSSLDKLLEERAAIDVFSMRGDNLNLFKEKGLAADITDRASVWSETSGMHQTAKVLMRGDDEQIYFIPNRIHHSQLYYRKDWFDTKALQVPLSWQELYFVGKQLTNVKEDLYGYAISGGAAGAEALIQIIQDYNGTAVNANQPLLLNEGNTIFTTEEALEALKLYREMVIGISPTTAKDWTKQEQLQAFVEGKTAMLIQDADAIELLSEKLSEDKWAAAPLPSGASGKVHPVIDVSGWAIAAHSKYQEESWRLIRYLSTAEANNAIAAATGVVPIYAVDAEYSRLFESALYAPFVLMNNNTDRFQTIESLPNSDDLDIFYSKAAEASWEYILRRIGGEELLAVLDEAAKGVVYRK